MECGEKFGTYSSFGMASDAWPPAVDVTKLAITTT